MQNRVAILTQSQRRKKERNNSDYLLILNLQEYKLYMDTKIIIKRGKIHKQVNT